MASDGFVTQKIQDLVAKFGSSLDVEEINLLSVDLLKSLDDFAKTDQMKDDKLLSKLQRSGVALWNFVIAKRTAKKASHIACARARHVALHLTFKATFSDKSQTTARKQHAMALKAGRDWLDCNDVSMADNCFVVATECYLKLQKLIEDSTESQTHMTKDQLIECHDNMLKVYTFRAESLNQTQHETASEYIRKAKCLLDKTSQKQKEFISNICYNFGLDCYQKELYQHSEKWLCESIEVGGALLTISNEQKATTYQLLAMVFIELGEEEHFKKALEAIDLSLQQHVHLKSLQFKLKIMLLLNMDDAEIITVFHNIINDPVLKVESGLECIRLFVEKNRFKLCYDALDVMNSKYSNINENIQVQLKKLECLLTEKRIPEAKVVIQTELLRASKNGAAFDKNILKQLQLLLWETAHQFFEKSNFLESLCWYNYSLQFMEQSNDDHDNLSKLQRNRCSCFLEMKNYTEALAAMKEAKSHDSNSPQVYFLLFKIHLLMNSDDQAIEAVEKLSQLGLESDSVEHVHGLICLAAQLAFECGNRKISEAVLEKMIVHVKEPKQLLVSLRCLTRLKFTNLSENSSLEEVRKILHLVEKANGIFKNMNGAELKDMHQEISWFNKIAWNLALSSSDFPNEMQQSFLICYELSQMLPKEELNFSQQKSCLLMATGCGLQNARDLRTEQEKADKLREVLDIVKQYYIVYEKLKENNASFQDPMLGFLLCYEFEVKARLGQHDLDDLFEKAMQLPSGQVKVFENFASSSLSIPDAMENSVKALKLAIKCHMEQTKVDFPAVSKIIHSLISVSLQKGGNTNAASKEDAYKFYEDTLKIIEGEAQGQYPEMEIIWLMTKAWNCGIHLYSAHHHEVAQKWCTLSMKFLKHLKELKSNYEPHMSSVFADVLSRIQQSKIQMQVEE